MSDDVLVEVTRGNLVESSHRGAVAVMDAEGAVVFQVGDIDVPVFPRSAVKAIQALPLLETGAADDMGLTDAELALACASHSGEPDHAAAAASMLRKAGRDSDCLECGSHWPLGVDAAHALAASGERPSALHNNCSGKHAGFVCTACTMGVDPTGYVGPNHPVMRAVTAALAEVTGLALDAADHGTDGCSIPAYAIPLRNLALGFARFGTGHGFGAARAAAARRLRAAVAAHPFMVAGTGRFDTDFMTAFGARAFVKTGAEGVYCAALPDLGFGLAVKCDDGAGRAAQVVTAALVRHFLRPGDEAASGVLDRLARPELRNWHGTLVGEMRPAGLCSGCDTRRLGPRLNRNSSRRTQEVLSMSADPVAFRIAAHGDEDGDGAAVGAVAAFPFDRLTVERFRAAFPQARWRDDLGAWFVPGTTAPRRLSTWQAREWPAALAFADQRGRDAYAFDPVNSPYLEPGDDLVIKTPYSRTVIDELRAVPWSHWDGAAKVWRVPYRSWEELRRRWPAIEAAASHAEPAERRLRAALRTPMDDATRALAAERRRHRYPVPDDALPPTGRVMATHLGCVVFEDITGELAEPDVVSRLYPEIRVGDAAAIWATWRRPTHAELVKAWPARHPADAAVLARGWWQPDLELLRAKRRQAASLERAQASRRGHQDEAAASQPTLRSET